MSASPPTYLTIDKGYFYFLGTLKLVLLQTSTETDSKPIINSLRYRLNSASE